MGVVIGIAGSCFLAAASALSAAWLGMRGLVIVGLFIGYIATREFAARVG